MSDTRQFLEALGYTESFQSQHPTHIEVTVARDADTAEPRLVIWFSFDGHVSPVDLTETQAVHLIAELGKAAGRAKRVLD